MNNNNQCQFEASTNTSSATICKWCGQEKWQHYNNTTMSNNKQHMKLYTEEQVMDAIKYGQNYEKMDKGEIPYVTDDEFINSLTSIELPSDEEMVKTKYEHEMCVFADEYASYVLEQSKSGIKGAMVSMCAWTFFKNRRNEQQ